MPDGGSALAHAWSRLRLVTGAQRDILQPWQGFARHQWPILWTFPPAGKFEQGPGSGDDWRCATRGNWPRHLDAQLTNVHSCAAYSSTPAIAVRAGALDATSRTG